MNKLLKSQTGIEYLVKNSLKDNKDFKKLEDIAYDAAPEDWSETMYARRKIDDYLDKYNTLMEEYSGNRTDLIKKQALWETYREIAEDNGVNVRWWFFNSFQSTFW